MYPACGRIRAVDPLSAQLARQNIESAKARKNEAYREFQDEGARGRKFGAQFYTNLALFSGGTIVLSITYLGYLKSLPNRNILYPKTLIAAWIVLEVCVVLSLFWTLLNSYYTHYARLGIYVEKLIEESETLVEELDNLWIVNATTPEDREETKKHFAEKTIAKRKDRKWAAKREIIFQWLSVGSGVIARITFPVGIGLLTFFAIKNM